VRTSSGRRATWFCEEWKRTCRTRRSAPWRVAGPRGSAKNGSAVVDWRSLRRMEAAALNEALGVAGPRGSAQNGSTPQLPRHDSHVAGPRGDAVAGPRGSAKNGSDLDGPYDAATRGVAGPRGSAKNGSPRPVGHRDFLRVAGPRGFCEEWKPKEWKRTGGGVEAIVRPCRRATWFCEEWKRTRAGTGGTATCTVAGPRGSAKNGSA
jgi:hypothetical protein